VIHINPLARGGHHRVRRSAVRGANVVGKKVLDIAELTYSAGFNGTSNERLPANPDRRER